MIPRMESRRYVLFLQFEWIENILDLVRTNIAGIINQASESNIETFIGVVGKPNAETKDEEKGTGLSWLKLIGALVGDLDSALAPVSKNEAARFDSNKVAEDIHGLADMLPAAGFHLDIIWPVTAETVCPVEDNLALFGALQRLKTWHNAHLTIAMVQDGYSWSIDPWLTYLKGEVKQLSKDCGSLLDWDLVWRGDMRFRDGKGVSVVSLPGFTLMKAPEEDLMLTVDEVVPSQQEAISASQDQNEEDMYKQLTAFERNLDVIHILKLEDVPSCLVSSRKFILWLFSEGKDNGMALLVRLGGTRALASALKDTGGDDGKLLKTEEWKKHMYQVPSLETKGHQFALNLLLHGDKAGGCIARVMHAPHQMNAAIHVQISESEILFDADDKADELTTSSIPLFDGDKLVDTEEELDCIQQRAIKEFIELRTSEGENATVTIDEIKKLMTVVRKEYLAEIKNIQPLKQVEFMNNTQAMDLESVQTELDQSPSEWLERLYIHQKESVEKKMKRYKSSDMMLKGMMVKKCKDNTIRLDAEEFLKHFDSDGHASAIEEALSPIGMTAGSVAKSNHTQQYDEEILKDREQTWKVLLKHDKYPGIGYCLDLKKAQQEDDHFVKMQQKLVWNETASTCTMEQAASPATMEIRSSKVKPEVKGQTKRKLSDSAKKRAMRGVKRKSDDAESSQANKRRLLRGDAVEETFVKPSSTQRVIRNTNSLEAQGYVPIRSSPRRQTPLTKIARIPKEENKRRASTSSVSSSSSKVTMTTIDAAGRKKQSRSSSSSSTTSSRSRSGGSRKQKHTEILQGIVDELLKSKDINKDHPIYPQCSKRLFNTTKDYVRALPPNSYPSLTKEMKNIASQNVDFVVSFEERLHAAKEKK